MTEDVIKGIKTLVKDSKKFLGPLKENVLNIGCNDGSLLDQFKNKVLTLLGLNLLMLL